MTKNKLIVIKKEAFKYIIKKLVDWHIEVVGEVERSENGQIHIPGFDRFKAFTLHFFTSAVRVLPNLDHYGLLEVFDKFMAYQSGPVEEDIYNALKEGDFEDTFTINSSVGLQVNNKELYDKIGEELDEFIRTEIDNSVNELKTINKDLITENSATLIEISHRWKSWRANRIKVPHGAPLPSYNNSMDYYLIKHGTPYYKY